MDNTAKRETQSQPVQSLESLEDGSESRFLNLPFEDLMKVDVVAPIRSYTKIEIEVQKSGVVQSKPVDFLSMSFAELTRIPVRVATVLNQDKKDKKDVKEVVNTGISSDAKVPPTFSDQSKKISANPKVHSVPKEIEAETESTELPTITPPFTTNNTLAGTLPVPEFIVTGNRNSNSLTILLRNADSSFSLKSNLVASNPNEVIVADFNQDGIPDLAVASQGSNSVIVYIGSGHANFGSPSFFPATVGAQGLVAGDFNGDGLLDIAVVRLINTFSVILGNGLGSFGPPSTYFYGGSAFSIATGDFNGDNALDIVIGNTATDTLTVLLGTGTGAFGAPSNFAVGNFPLRVITADFNNDHVLDLACTNVNDATVSVLLGTGSGAFGGAINAPVGSSPGGLATGDFNFDGNLDIVVANRAENTISVLLGNGTGSFLPQTKYVADGNPEDVTVADFNGDGILDIASSNANSNNVSIFYGIGDGTFHPAINYAIGGDDPLTIAFGVLGAGAVA